MSAANQAWARLHIVKRFAALRRNAVPLKYAQDKWRDLPIYVTDKLTTAHAAS